MFSTKILPFISSLALAALAGCGSADQAAGADDSVAATGANENVAATTEALSTTFIGCRGAGNFACVDTGVNAAYFAANPGCSPNNTCADRHYACTPSICPMPKANEINRPSVPMGHSFFPGETVMSPNGSYKAVWQTDGNLVGYRISAGAPSDVKQVVAVWDSSTEGSGVDQLEYQTDGNLVMYKSVQHTVPGGCFNVNGTPCTCGTSRCISSPGYTTTSHPAVWDTATNGSPRGSYLLMQDDSNFVMYSPTGGVEWSAE